MNVRTANSQFNFELPSMSYIDAKWEEPALRSPGETRFPARRTGLAGWLARRMEAYRAWQRDRQAASELTAMSDHELMDIGISRSDLARVFDSESNQDLRERGNHI